MIRLTLADDHPIMRDGVRRLLAEQPDIEVVGEASDGNELLALLRADLPDVVLCDMTMPGRSGIALLKVVRSEWPRLRILVLSAHADDIYAVRAIKAGAAGYVTKAAPAEQLLTAIRRVAAGRLYIGTEVAEQLALQAITGNSARHEALSDREQQVFLQLAEGHSVTAIARQLHLSVKTISTHKTNIMQKMALPNLAALVRYALEHDLAGGA